MKIVRRGSAAWSGGIKDGKGSVSTESGALNAYPYGFAARFEDQAGTNPEELLAATHAGCFTMQLSHLLAENGTPADRLETKSVVSVEPKDGGGFSITGSDLTLKADVPGIADDVFQAIAGKAKSGCPVSVALASIEITLQATLKQQG